MDQPRDQQQHRDRQPDRRGEAEAVAQAISAMNARLGLPTGLGAMGVTESLFDAVITGALADHCHKTNPRIATPEEYEAILAESL